MPWPRPLNTHFSHRQLYSGIAAKDLRSILSFRPAQGVPQICHHSRSSKTHTVTASHSVPKLRIASSHSYDTFVRNGQSAGSSKAPTSSVASPTATATAMTNLPVPGLALNASASAFTPTNTSQESVVNSTTAAKAKSKKGIKRKQRKDIVKSKQASVAPHRDPPPNSTLGLTPSSTSTSTSHQVVQVSKARQPPSVASGGIPSPSISYLAQSLLPSSSLPQPRRILVVVDLNGTLLHRPSRRRPSSFVERPHARPFLKYCLETFHLAIWSSARAQNVNNMVNQLLTPEERKKCLVIWARDRLGLSQSDYDARVQVYKRLSLLWKDPVVRASNPDSAARQGGAGTWDQSNTVLVDDSPEKGRSEPYNILPIPEFSGLDGEVPNVLPQVHDYLNQLCFQADISRFMRETPFVLDPNYALPVDS